MDKKYNIEYLNKTRKAIYLEVEASVAEDIDCAFQWAIARIKQLEEIIEKIDKLAFMSNTWIKDAKYLQEIIENIKLGNK